MRASDTLHPCVIKRALVVLATLAMTILALFVFTQKAQADDIASGTWGTCPWEISADGVLTIHPGTGEEVVRKIDKEFSQSFDTNFTPWILYSNQIKHVVFQEEGGKKVIAPASCGYIFTGCFNLKTVDLSGLDTSSTTSMAWMFSTNRVRMGYNTPNWSRVSIESIRSLDALDTSSVRDMHAMFKGCESISSLDVASLDTSTVTDMGEMFRGCESLKSLDVASLDTSSVTDMAGLFQECSSLRTLDVSMWDTSSVTNMSGAFYNCTSLESVDPRNWDTSSVGFMDGMFYNCSSLKKLDLSRWDTSKVTGSGLASIFSGCTSLESLDISHWDTSKATSVDGMFRGCESLKSLDLSSFDTSAVRHFDNMFTRCWSLSTIRLGTRTVKLDSLPAYEIDGNGHLDWYSSKAGEWFTSAQIKTSRLGIADTYTKTPPGNANGKDNPSAPSSSGGQSGSDGSTAALIASRQSMHRLYNPNSGEHFYTASTTERDNLTGLGWNYEGVGWTAPGTSNTPVYRLYNANGGEHHYTPSAGEKDALVSAGWSYEGIGWYSDDAQMVPLYRDYNPNQFANNHNYTTSSAEHEWLVSLGWRWEGYAWYGV